jgi:hypothetical protein
MQDKLIRVESGIPADLIVGDLVDIQARKLPPLVTLRMLS